jgi:hypothetical protein
MHLVFISLPFSSWTTLQSICKHFIYKPWTIFAGYKILRAVVMKSCILWNISTCSKLKITRRVGGTFHLHLVCWRASQAQLCFSRFVCNMYKYHAGSLFCFPFNVEGAGHISLRNAGWIFKDYTALCLTGLACITVVIFLLNWIIIIIMVIIVIIK